MKVYLESITSTELYTALQIYGNKLSVRKTYDEVKEEEFERLSKLRPLPVLDKRSIVSKEVSDDFEIKVKSEGVDNSSRFITLENILPSEIEEHITSFKQRLNENVDVSRVSEPEPINYSNMEDEQEEEEEKEPEQTSEYVDEEDEDFEDEDIDDSEDEDDFESDEEDDFEPDFEEDEDDFEPEEEEEHYETEEDDDDFSPDEDEFEEDDFSPDKDEDEDDFEEDEEEDEFAYEEDELEESESEEDFEPDEEEENFEPDEEDFEPEDVEFDENEEEEENFEPEEEQKVVEELPVTPVKPILKKEEVPVIPSPKPTPPKPISKPQSKPKISLESDLLGTDEDFISKIMNSSNTDSTQSNPIKDKVEPVTEEIKQENLPPDPIAYLRLHPRSNETDVKKLYSAKEVDNLVNRGLITRSRGKLFI